MSKLWNTKKKQKKTSAFNNDLHVVAFNHGDLGNVDGIPCLLVGLFPFMAPLPVSNDSGLNYECRMRNNAGATVTMMPPNFRVCLAGN